MEIIQAIILGIIEGLTEFLPISSTGHLLVSENLMGYKDTAEIFAIVIQIGAILAVIWHYRRDLIKKVIGLFKKDKEITGFWVVWVTATVPAGLAGLFLHDKISKYSLSWLIGVTLIIGGVIIYSIETFHKSTKNASIDKPNFSQISFWQSLKIGCYQILALVPGVSRSGATIMGGLVSGLDRVTATAFSFYLSIPILLLAGSYQLYEGRNSFDTVAGGGLALLAGTVTAFITALLAISWLLKYVSHHDFKIFAYYRIIVGLIILSALYFN